MIPIVEDSILGTDLNCEFYSLLNCNALVPVPPGLVASDDPRLTDARPPTPGSVTNISVAADAAIDQNKLDLNGQIPPAWLGTSATTAAAGNLAEYLANKGVANGYCELDATGKVPTSRLPGTTGTGTVTSVGLTMPVEFAVTGSPVTTAGSIAVNWSSVVDLSWFGNMEGIFGPPQFYTDPLPFSLIPDLDAAKVTTGVFNRLRIPLAIGLGVTHAPGAVPDPGDGTGGALATDYLARDMTFKAAPIIGVAYQPTLPNPVITPSSSPVNPVPVYVTCAVTDAIIMYSITSASTGFQELPSVGYVHVTSPGNLWAYVSHPGYNNSAVVTSVV